MAENTNTALLTTLARMANHAESHRETTSHSYQALQRAYEEDRNAVDAVAKMIAERDALAAEVEALRADAERLGWLDAQNISKRMGWKVNVAPLGNVSVQSVIFLGSEPVKIRDAIDAARASAATGGGNE